MRIDINFVYTCFFPVLVAYMSGVAPSLLTMLAMAAPPFSTSDNVSILPEHSKGTIVHKYIHTYIPICTYIHTISYVPNITASKISTSVKVAIKERK